MSATQKKFPGNDESLTKKFPGNDEFTAEFFDESSKAWLHNKRRKGESMVYLCAAICKTGNPCSNSALPMKTFCRTHRTCSAKERKANLVN